MSEKRHFKIYAAKHVIGEKNKYVRMFDAIDKLTEHNAEKNIKIEGVNKHVSLLKARLQEAILKSLSTYHTSSVAIKLRNYLNYAAILYGKSLFNLCIKVLKKAKKLALLHEEYYIIPEIITWEWNTYVSMGDLKKLKEVLDEDLDLIKKNLSLKETAMVSYKHINELIILVKSTDTIRTNTEMEKAHKIIQDASLNASQGTLSFKDQQNLNSCYAKYYGAVNDLNKAYEFAQKIVDAFEEHPEKIMEKPKHYIRHLFNLLNHLKYKDAFFPTLEKLRTVPKMYSEKFTTLKGLVFVYSFHQELEFYILQGEFKKAVLLTKEIEMGLIKYRSELPQSFLPFFYFNIFYSYFGVCDHAKARVWLNKILNSTTNQNPEMQEIYCLSKILNLIIHLELYQNNLLEHSLRYTYKYLSENEKLYKTESTMIHFIKDIVHNITSNKQIIKEYEKLKDNLIQLKNDPLEQCIFDKFDFISWADSKIQQRPFAAIIKEKCRMTLELKSTKENI